MPEVLARKSTPLRSGYSICFNPKNQCLWLFDENGVIIRWENSDDKKIVEFIKSNNEFADLARLLGEMFGLRIKKAHMLTGYSFEYF